MLPRVLSPQRKSGANLVWTINVLSAVIYPFIDTDVIVPHNERMGCHGSVAYLDGVRLAAPFSSDGGILSFGLA
jgi:hypothetical protein